MSSNLRAIAVLPPQGNTQTAVSSTSTAAIDTGEHTKRIVLQSTEDCYIRFGESGMDACVNTDFPINADQPYTFDIVPGRRYFRALRVTSDGTINWYVAS